MSVLSRLRGIFAARQTEDPRYPAERRIPVTARTLAGIVVTADNCVTVPTVWACLRYLSQTVAVLPWHVMRQGELGNERASSHPLDSLLYTRVNPEWSSFQFRESLTHWALRWGNGYAEIERDPLGRPVALWPLHPSRVQVLRDEQDRMFYRVHNGTLPSVDLKLMDMFHVRGFGEGPVGVNVVDYAAESIGWARAAQLFGAGFFGNGLNVSGVVQQARPLSEDGLKRLKASFNRMYRGVRGEKVMYLDAGMEFKPIGMEPEKAQFLGTNIYLVSEICRWFGVPPHKVGEMSRSTNNNVESQVVEVVVDSVSPWVRRFEDEANYKLFGQNRPGYFTKMNMNALMRADAATRAAFYQTLRQQGVVSANELRDLEDMNRIPASEGGDKLVMQSQYTTLEKIGETPEPPASPALPVPPATETEAPETEAPDPDETPTEPAASATARDQAVLAQLLAMEFEYAS
jgi:HK97 family phage portal protein